MLAELETDTPDDFYADAADVVRRAKELAAKLKKAISEVAEVRIRNPNATDLEAAWTKLDAIRDEQYALVSSTMCWRWSPQEIRSWCDRAVEMGAVHPRFTEGLLLDLMRMTKVPVAPLRDWIEASKHTTKEALLIVSEAVGRDERELRRNFGYATNTGGSGTPSLTTFASYELVADAAKALGIPPYEIGV